MPPLPSFELQNKKSEYFYYCALKRVEKAMHFDNGLYCDFVAGLYCLCVLYIIQNRFLNAYKVWDFATYV